MSDEKREWRCFHCDKVFTDHQAALDHFGSDCLATPVCQIPDLAHLHRSLHALGAEGNRREQDQEEKGYAKGLSDGREEAAALVKQVRLLLANDGRDGVYHAGICFDARAAIVEILKGFPQ